MEFASVMPVLCRINLLWPQQTVLSGTRFHHMGNCSTALCEHVIVCAPPPPLSGLTSPDFTSVLSAPHRQHITYILGQNSPYNSTNTK